MNPILLSCLFVVVDFKCAFAIIDMTRDFSEECIRAHNVKRRLHGVPSLVYGEELSSHAEKGAYQSAIKKKMLIPDGSTFGKNIASSTIKRTCEEVVDLWYKDQKYYNFNKPGYKSESGAFTQVIWKSSERVACSQHSQNHDAWFTVCVYDPPGNIQDIKRFKENVLPSYSAPIKVEEEISSIDINTDSIVDLTTKSFQKNCIQAHNKVRRAHRVEDLVYDPTLLAYAKKKVSEFVTKGKVDYSDSQFGANSMMRTRPLYCDYAVDKWYEQKKFYDFDSPMYYDDATGFMQLVWKDSRKFACATAQSRDDSSKYYLVCIYDPTGLVRGQYKENIKLAAKRVVSAAEYTTQPSLAAKRRTTTTTVTLDKEIPADFYGYSIFRYGAG